MAKVFDFITEELQKFIINQKIFFVGTAPLSSTTHVNLSPKGIDKFSHSLPPPSGLFRCYR
jgi:hypothetical protein